MVRGRSLALILFSLAPQDAEVPNLRERALKTLTLEGCELEEETIELERSVDAVSPEAVQQDVRRAYVTATTKVLWTAPQDLCQGETLARRLERARKAAQLFGADYDRLRVENQYAEILLSGDFVAEARAVLKNARERFAIKDGQLALNLELAVAAAVRACDYASADSLALRAQALFDRLLLQESRPRLRLPLLEWQVLLLSHQARMADLLGLPDQAFLLLERQGTFVDEVIELDPASPARMRAVLSQCDIEQTMRSFDRVLERIEAVQGEVSEPGVAADLSLRKAVALRELARGGRGDTQKAERLLRAVRELPSASAKVREDADWYLADLLVEQGEHDEADRILVASLARTASPEPGREACWKDEARTRAVALRARIALKRVSAKAVLEAFRVELERLEKASLEATRRTVLRPDGIGFLHWSSRRSVLSTLILLELATKAGEPAVEAAFEHVLRAQELGTLARSLSLAAVDLGALREHLLAEHQGWIVFMPGWEESHLFTIDRGGIEHHPLGARDELIRAVAEFASLSRPASSSVVDAGAIGRKGRDEAGKKLRELLFPAGAIARIDGWKALYVSGLDLIGSPPFDGLPWIRDRPLGEEKAISHLPSLTVGSWLSRRASTRPVSPGFAHLVAVAAPQHSPRVARDWPASPPFQLEMSQRTSLVEPFSAAKFLTGSGATLDALVSELAQGASVLEFITHGVHDFGRRRPAGLVLTPANDDDGVLWCEDIEERLSVPPLVVLLACGTAFGPTRLGDDTAALLGNSFLLRGADVVLLSRTSVEYGAMLALAGAFHRHLADTDTSPAEALRRARIDLAGLAIWSDIRHHGQICLFGLGLAPLPMRFEPAPEPTKVADSAVRAWLLAAAAVGAVAAIAARTWIRRRAAISARV